MEGRKEDGNWVMEESYLRFGDVEEHEVAPEAEYHPERKPGKGPETEGTKECEVKLLRKEGRKDGRKEARKGTRD
jgi:hypothetical protein